MAGEANTNLLLDVLQTPSLGSQILTFVRFGDLQRLKVSCKTLHNLLDCEEQYKRIVLWLKNVEALYCVEEDHDREILQRIVKSLWEYPERARFMCHDTAGTPISELARNDVLEAFEEYAYISFEPNINGTVFSTITEAQMNELCNEPEEAFLFFNNNDDNVDGDNDDEEEEHKHNQEEEKGDVSDDSREEEENPRKRFKALECSSHFCCRDKSQEMDRFFFIPNEDKPYCGYCLDHFKLLKLRFCAKHVNTSQVDWEIGESDYDEIFKKEEDQDSDDDDEEDSEEEGWGLQEDEFMAQVFHVAPYESGWFNFLGVGPRG